MSLPLVPDANHPAFPTRSKVDDWEIKRPAIPECGGEMAVIGRRCAQAKPSTETYSDQSHRRRPIRLRTSPRNQPGSRREERAARPTRRAGQAERTPGHVDKKKSSGSPKEKIKSKSISMEKEIKTGNGDNAKTNPREEPKWKDIARS